ncbi:hypothetical protein B5C34_06560 [Pacificimonas flava]|uniref:TonB-dependent receptor n=2 Tax=Pacificimonas TaxID=1960290 RepID=A0A219B5V1_9SPHN|nr:MULTISPECIES: TonB-dependent receptor [Pacificimonas]MBZ6377114.1 TonB-dependent receptor [Pacificimonas aurantium]OWV33158.1 hypothetical protein B5C34_06560 [Pacificimonas flava]
MRHVSKGAAHVAASGFRFCLKGTTALTVLATGTALYAQEVAVTPEEADSSQPELTGSAAVESQSGIPTIVVTAQRRAESLQDVPVAVSAFSDESLADQQLDNALDLQQALPSTTFTKGNFTGANITIRGIGSPVVSTSSDPGVAVHFNDMPIVAPRLFETEFYDLERLEVLRGPQGTLFGRNATGGVINLITAKPSFDFEAAGEFEYGNFDSVQAKGMVNVPLGDIAAVRLAGLYLNRDGFTENLFTGNDIDGRDNYSVRGSFLVEPSDRARLFLTAQYYEEDSNRSRIQKQLCASDPTGILGCRPDRLGFDSINGDSTLATILTSPELLRVLGADALAPFALGSVYGDDGQAFSNSVNPRDLREVKVDFEPTYDSDELIIQGEFSYEFDRAVFTLNGGYVDNQVVSRTDYNLSVTDDVVGSSAGLLTLQGAAAAGSPLAQGFLATPLFQDGLICVSDPGPANVGFIGGDVERCAANTTEYDESRASNEQWVIEGRIATDFDGPFNFLLGGIYLEQESNNGNYYVVATGLDYGSLLLGTAQNLAAGDPLGTGGVAALATPFFNNETNFYKLESYGIFGEVYVDVSDDLSLTGGLRYSNDKKFQRGRSPLATALVPIGIQDANDALLTVDNDPGAAGVQPFAELGETFDAFTGRVVVDWNPFTTFSDDTLVYASYSRGYKAGGINPPFNPETFPEANATFDSEQINAFEIGTKNVFGGGRFVLNLTGFYYDYSDLQISRIIARTSFNDNADASVYGIELESIINPVDALTINLTGSWLKTEIKDLLLPDPRDPSGGRDDVTIIKDITNASNCAVIPTEGGGASAADFVGLVNAAVFGGAELRAPVPVPGTQATGAFSVCETLGAIAASPGAFGAPLEALLRGSLGVASGPLPFLTTPSGLPAGVEQNLDGNELLNSPEWKFSIGAQYEIEMANGWRLTPRADLNFTGEQFGRIFNANADRIQSYEIVNAQLTLASPDERFYLRGFVQNAFDSGAITGIYFTDASSGNFTNIFSVEPRRYGAAMGLRF